MMTGLRRILVTALLGVLVGLGVITALFGRRPRPRITGPAEDLVPVTGPSSEAEPARGGRSLAAGLVILLLLTGLIGIIYAGDGIRFGPGSHPTGDGKPLAALSPPAGGTDRAPAPNGTAPTGAAPMPEPGRQAVPAPSDASTATAPSFDVVRVEPNGDTVVAGRAAPNATVELLVDGRPVGNARADADGYFTFVPPPLRPGTSEIGLRSTDEKGGTQHSAARVAVVVAQSRNARPLVAVTAPDMPTRVLSRPDRTVTRGLDSVAEPGRPTRLGQRDASARDATDPEIGPRGSDIDGRATVGVQAGARRQGDAGPNRAGATTPAGPIDPVRDPHPLDKPVAGAPTPEVVSIDARDGGRLFVTARAAAGAALRLYLNDTLIAPATVGRDGTVTFTIGHGVRPGDYRVRLDVVDPATGKVRDRAEVPFSAPAAGHDEGVEYSAGLQGPARAVDSPEASQRPAAGDGRMRRESPTDAADPPQPSRTGSLAANAPQAAGGGTSEIYVPGIETARIVRGDNLWRISRRIYGAGERYTLIYDANQDQIRDPDLIYPGQVFVLPGRDTGNAGADGKRD